MSAKKAEVKKTEVTEVKVKLVGQAKRNIDNAVLPEASLICLLPPSSKQNYKIDKNLEVSHTMEELVELTGCTASRIKSHIAYVKKNCLDRVKQVIDGKSFCFQVI